jgi:DNA-directed RNA polymerase subunit L
MEQQYTVRKYNERELEIEIYGEDHTLGFILSQALSRMEGVEESYYRVEHPLKNSIVVYVRTDGSIGPREAVTIALKNTKDIVEQLYQLVKKGLEIEERS